MQHITNQLASLQQVTKPKPSREAKQKASALLDSVKANKVKQTAKTASAPSRPRTLSKASIDAQASRNESIALRMKSIATHDAEIKRAKRK